MSDAVEQPSLSTVYLLTNPAMPGLVKIGRTSRTGAKARIDQLYSTSVPVPFEPVFACKVPNPSEVELALHRAFAPHRVSPKREFFRIDPEQVLAILRLLHVEETTDVIKRQPTTLDPVNWVAARDLRRRPHLDFTAMGIPVGAVLRSTDTDATVTVAGPRKVRLADREMSLTAATRAVLKLDHSIPPGGHWTYEARLIGEMMRSAGTNRSP